MAVAVALGRGARRRRRRRRRVEQRGIGPPFSGVADLRRGVQRGDTVPQRRDGRRREVGLGDEDAVGQGRLPARLVVAVERRRAVDGRHQRHHPAESGRPGQSGAEQQGVEDGGRVGDARGFDQDAVEAERRATLQQALDRGEEVPARRAADAAGGQHQHVAVHRLDQEVVDAHLAELVDDHGRAGEGRVGEQAVQQRGLAGPEEAGQHAHGNGNGHAPAPVTGKRSSWRLWRQASRRPWPPPSVWRRTWPPVWPKVWRRPWPPAWWAPCPSAQGRGDRGRAP